MSAPDPPPGQRIAAVGEAVATVGGITWRLGCLLMIGAPIAVIVILGVAVLFSR